MTDDLKLAASHGDRIAQLFLIIYKLGGWAVLAIVATIALKYVWDERASTNADLIKELRDGKRETMQIISQNATALTATATSQDKVATAVEQLTQEVRRNNQRP